MQGSRWGRLGYRYAVGVMGAVAVAAMLGVAGCSGGSDPAPSDSPTTAVPTPSVTSVSPTPSPSVSVPEAARAHTQEGGIEFAKYYVTELGKAQSAPDATVIDALTLSDCAGCGLISKTVHEYVAGGYRIRDSRLTVDGAQASSVVTDIGFDIDVLGTERASVLLDSTGSVVRETPEARLWLRVGVQWTDQGWRVARLDSVTP